MGFTGGLGGSIGLGTCAGGPCGCSGFGGGFGG